MSTRNARLTLESTACETCLVLVEVEVEVEEWNKEATVKRDFEPKSKARLYNAI